MCQIIYIALSYPNSDTHQMIVLGFYHFCLVLALQPIFFVNLFMPVDVCTAVCEGFSAVSSK